MVNSLTTGKHTVFTFERKLLGILCLMGSITMVAEIFIDSYPTVNEYFLTQDIILLVIFLSPIVLNRLGANYIFTVTIFSIVIVSLVTWNWLNIGGITGVSEYSLTVIIVFICLIHSGRRLLLFASFLTILLCALFYISYFNFAFIEQFIVRSDGFNPVGIIDYLILCIMSAITMVYFRFKFDERRFQIRKSQVSIWQKTKELELENAKLERQNLELENTRKNLKQKIDQRVEILEIQNTTINNYLLSGSGKIVRHLNKINESIQNVGKQINDPLIKMLDFSKDDLRQAVRELEDNALNNLLK
ncbi:MAG: hypothetical protein JXQ96_11690 [Cyclobacteriaceae bacterium]